MSNTIRSYQDLTAWQKAMALTKAVYQVTQSWPRLGYIAPQDTTRLLEQSEAVAQLLGGLLRSLRQ